MKLPHLFMLCLFAGYADLSFSAEKPNILVILADDMGWGDMRCHGNDRIDTPQLDQLAAESVELERFFVAPLCAPTRAAFLTGQHHVRHHVLSPSGGMDVMPSSAVTLAEVLRQNGYTTACFGKWHNGAAPATKARGQGFDEFLGFTGGFFSNYFDATLEHNGHPLETKGYITDVLATAAIEFIQRPGRQPFFVYLPFNVPHSPMQCPEALFLKYTRRGMAAEEAAACGMVEQMDTQIGRLLAQVNDNTVVVFFSDNGPNTPRFNGGMRGQKGSVHEGGVRVPCLIRWPGRLTPGKRAHIAQHTDLMPTLLDLAQIKTDLPFDGRSLAPLLRDSKAPWPDRPLFTLKGQAPPDGDPIAKFPASIRTERWRWVVEQGRAALYDMPADPAETKDVSAQHPEIGKQFRRDFETWFAEVTRSTGGQVKRHPFEIIPTSDLITLAAHDARLEGSARYFGQGWDNDWATGLGPSGAMLWKLTLSQPLRVRATAHYCVGEAGAAVRLELGGQLLEKSISAPHTPAIIPRPDRIPRKEVPDKAFAALDLGELDLPAGESTLRLTSPASASTLELQSLLLECTLKK